MLNTITFGHNAFHGESGAHRQQYRREPYGYKNKLTIRSRSGQLLLPRLSESHHDDHDSDKLPLLWNRYLGP